MTPRPLCKLSPKQIESFWSKVERLGPDECWLWKGSTTGRKHSTLRYGTWKVNNQNMRPHRVAWELQRGPLGDLTIDHVAGRCRSTLCVNVNHMEAVPHRINVARRGSTVPHIYRQTAEEVVHQDRAHIDRLAFGVNLEREPGLHAGESAHTACLNESFQGRCNAARTFRRDA